MEESVTVERIQDQHSRILQLVKDAIPSQSQEVPETSTTTILYTQPESICSEPSGKEQKSKYFVSNSPPDSTDGVIQMTQPSEISLRMRVNQHVNSQKRDGLARGLSSFGIDVFSWKREWTSRWRDLYHVCLK